MREFGFSWVLFIINPTPKPNVCSYQKHPFNHPHTHTRSSFLLVGFYIARKQPSSNIPPTFITALWCPIFLCQVTAPSQLGLNVALHKFLVSFALCVMLMGHQSYSAIKTGHHSDREGFKLKTSQGSSGWEQFSTIYSLTCSFHWREGKLNRSWTMFSAVSENFLRALEWNKASTRDFLCLNKVRTVSTFILRVHFWGECEVFLWIIFTSLTYKKTTWNSTPQLWFHCRAAARESQHSSFFF